jgi:hypothetical protein
VAVLTEEVGHPSIRVDLLPRNYFFIIRIYERKVCYSWAKKWAAVGTNAIDYRKFLGLELLIPLLLPVVIFPWKR